jgi:hypothetical protein
MGGDLAGETASVSSGGTRSRAFAARCARADRSIPCSCPELQRRSAQSMSRWSGPDDTFAADQAVGIPVSSLSQAKPCSRQARSVMRASRVAVDDRVAAAPVAVERLSVPCSDWATRSSAEPLTMDA